MLSGVRKCGRWKAWASQRALRVSCCFLHVLSLAPVITSHCDVTQAMATAWGRRKGILPKRESCSKSLGPLAIWGSRPGVSDVRNVLMSLLCLSACAYCCSSWKIFLFSEIWPLSVPPHLKLVVISPQTLHIFCNFCEENLTYQLFKHQMKYGYQNSWI